MSTFKYIINGIFLFVLLTSMGRITSSCKPTVKPKKRSSTPAPVIEDPKSDDLLTEYDEEEEEVEEEVSTFTGKTTGCLREQSIQKLEVILNGAIEADTKIDNDAKHSRDNYGVPQQFTFHFADGFAYSDPAALESIKQNNGVITIDQFNSYTVDQIKYIKITKDGGTFRSMPFQDYDLLKGNVTRYKVYETNRFRMNSILIRINGYDFYRLGGMQNTLSASSKEWVDTDFAQNLITKKILEEKCEDKASVSDEKNNEEEVNKDD